MIDKTIELTMITRLFYFISEIITFLLILFYLPIFIYEEFNDLKKEMAKPTLNS